MFPVLLGLACVATGLGYRIWAGKPLGPTDPRETESVAVDGIALNSIDTLTYATWAKQSVDGSFLLSDLFTTEPHRRLYFNPYFYLVGRLSNVCHTTPIAVMNVSLPLLPVPIMLLCYGIAVNLGYSHRAARLTCLLMAFASGWSWMLFAVRHAGAGLGFFGRNRFGADVEFGDTFPCTTMAVYPYHAAGLLLLCLVIYLWTLADKPEAPGSRTERWLPPATAISCGLLVAVRPYEFFLPAFSYAVFLGLTAFLAATGRPMPLGHRTRIFLASLVLSVPLMLYRAYIGTQPVWKTFAALSMSIHTTPLQWTIGLGPTLLFALAGVHLVLRDVKKARIEVLVAFWVVLLVAVLYFYNRGGSKLSHGGFLALSLLAARALEAAWDEIIALDSPRLRLAVALPLVLLMLTAVPTLPVGLEYYRTTPDLVALHRYDPEIVSLWERASIVLDRNKAVLCDTYTGNRLPPFLGCRVWAGHWSLTPDFEAKSDRLQRAGIIDGELGNSADTSDIAHEFASLWASAGCDYLLLKKDAPARAPAESAAALAIAAEGERWILFRRRESDGAH